MKFKLSERNSVFWIFINMERTELIQSNRTMQQFPRNTKYRHHNNREKIKIKLFPLKIVVMQQVQPHLMIFPVI